MCKAMNTPEPILPMSRNEEFKLFSELMLKNNGCELNQMVIDFAQRSNGETIFAKNKVYLNEYHGVWLRNRRVQDAIEKMKSEIDQLNDHNKEQLPAELV